MSRLGVLVPCTSVALLLTTPLHVRAQAPATPPAIHQELDRRAAAVNDQVIAWRRDFHQHPELANHEVRTAGIVAAELRRLGLEVRTGVAKTGVVAVLRGTRPGPVMALRADMDALPVTEETDVPFKSIVTTQYEGKTVGVMHACGHDTHTAMLLGAATVLSGMKDSLPGAVVFLFQPAEEGSPSGEEGGAALMVKEGVLDDPKVDAIFGLHAFSGHGLRTAGSLMVRPGGIMAASDRLAITIRGRQTHGGQPWAGVDPVVVAAQVIMGLQTIVSRQMNLTVAPVVATIATVEAGSRYNIVPEQVRMTGTLRTFDAEMRRDLHRRVEQTAMRIAEGAAATAEVRITDGTPVTWNDPALTAAVIPSLQRVASAGFDANVLPMTPAEDFSLYQARVPGVLAFLGVNPPGADPASVAPNHSPRFFVDERALATGARALASVAIDYLYRGPQEDPSAAAARP
ncbi:MAG TPA: amidohydrolase [Vicinamibacterales bacterium]|nr:amidohydrolase [Vicinamibacterales bacterium]